MEERKINLEEIILKAYGCNDMCDFINSYDISVQMIKEICIEACRQTLELAAENAEAWCYAEGNEPEYGVDKQSILNTIKQIE